jgi:hypothetical protein
VIALVSAAFVTRRREKGVLEKDRAALADAVRMKGAGVSAEERLAVAHTESWLARLAAAYEGDVLADSVRGKSAFEALVHGSAVYVHGSVAGFENANALAATTNASLKDAFALCLLDPPESRGEKALMARVRVAYSNAAMLEQKTANVRRFRDERETLRVLSPPFAASVLEADEHQLSVLKTELERAHVDRGIEALRATLLIAVMDEPGKSGAAELDGERPHDVRVAIVDLPQSRVLMRLRLPVDPSGWSANVRTEYASGIDGCALAFDVRDRAGR